MEASNPTNRGDGREMPLHGESILRSQGTTTESHAAELERLNDEIRAEGGRMWLESSVAEGSTFHFSPPPAAT